MSHPTATKVTDPADLVRPGYIGQINADWVRRCDTPLPDRWSTTHPVLSGHQTMGELLGAIRSTSGAHADAFLRALLELHDGGRGDALAGRVLLQTMLGSAQCLTRTAKGRGLDDPDADAVAAIWAAIRSYPLRRQHSVAANLRLDALNRLPAAPEWLLPAGELLEAQIHEAQSSGRWEAVEVIPVDAEAAATLRWARDTAILDEDEARLLALIYLSPTRVPSADLADQFGIEPAALRKRQSRAVAKLARGVAERLSEPKVDAAA